MRDHEQAEKDLQELQDILAGRAELPVWALDQRARVLLLREAEARFDVKFKPDRRLAARRTSRSAAATWPRRRACGAPSREMLLHRVPPLPQLHPRQRGDAEGRGLLAVPLPDLRQDARRAEEERRPAGASGPDPREQFDPEGRKAIRARIEPLFDEVKQKYPTVFRGNEEITLSDRALAFMVSELAKYDFGRTDVDAKGAAYQEIVGTNLRGDRGQYFTPRGAIKLDGADARPQAERARARPGVRHRRLPRRRARAPRTSASTEKANVRAGSRVDATSSFDP